MFATFEHEDTLTVELAVLNIFDPKAVPGAQKLAPALCQPG
jgi:hypothetical protein